jgi:hypothetical protein
MNHSSPTGIGNKPVFFSMDAIEQESEYILNIPLGVGATSKAFT